MTDKYYVFDNISYDGGDLDGPYDTLSEAKKHISNDTEAIIKGEIVWKGLRQIEVGKIYRTANGKKVSITYLSNFRTMPYLGVIAPIKIGQNHYLPEEVLWYNGDGSTCEKCSDYDIVEEIQAFEVLKESNNEN